MISEHGTLPPPPTEDELNRMRIVRLKGLAKYTADHFHEPGCLNRRYLIEGFRIEYENWGQTQTVRDTIMKLWHPSRSSGIA